MKILLTNVGKRYNRQWVFKQINLEFESGNTYAVTGPNGSGKSTLLQCIGGLIGLSEGTISYHHNDHYQFTNIVFRHTTLCAPYMELIEEMTLREFLEFHARFKPFRNQLTPPDIARLIQLEKETDKQIRNFSSGMKQRVKLAQAFFPEGDIILLDEPCTNLDAAGIDLYHSLVQQFAASTVLIVSSNDETEYRFCRQIIEMKDLKAKIN